ncbi:unnamed protein product, partial [Staurois parvus]
MQRKVTFHFPQLFCKVHFGTWRFQSDLGGMKSSILGPMFGNGQDTDCSGVHGNLLESGPGFWAPPWQTGGLCHGVRRVSPRRGGSQ